MKITKEWLKKEEACREGIKWFIENYPDEVDHKELYRALQVKHKGWGYWLIGHIGGAEFGIRCGLAVYFEPTWVQWANDWLSGKDRSAWAATKAAEAARAAESAARAAESAWAATRAAESAWAAAWAADDAAWAAARAARAAAEAAAWSAAWAAKPDIDLLAILDECECMKAERSEGK